MKKTIKLFFIISVMMFTSVTANAETSSAAAQLIQQLKSIKTLQADFIQENYDTRNHLLQKQTGNFKIMDSGEFIWNTASPYEQKIICDGTTLKMFDPDLEQVTIKSMDKKTQLVPLLLFGGNGENISRQYEISSSKKNTFDLRSRDKNSLFEKLQISFENAMPISMSIIDSMNQTTQVRFEKVITNQPLKASMFQFEIPTGADVIDER